jgi:hypothetical protein
MYNWTNVTIPKITDVFNNTSRNPARLFTYPWVEFLGPWFFAMLIGALSGALFMKYQKPIVPVVFFIVCTLLLGRVLPEGFIYVVGLIGSFVIGFVLYNLFMKQEE